jgi:hypothetical protein
MKPTILMLALALATPASAGEVNTVFLGTTTERRYCTSQTQRGILRVEGGES